MDQDAFRIRRLRCSSPVLGTINIKHVEDGTQQEFPMEEGVRWLQTFCANVKEQGGEVQFTLPGLRHDGTDHPATVALYECLAAAGLIVHPLHSADETLDTDA